jgi:cell pole-organizing protein PopZ
VGDVPHGHPEHGHPEPVHGAGEADPSMDDILASIRRILSEDEASDAAASRPHDAPGPDVLVLDPAMMVHEPEPWSPPEPASIPAPPAQEAAPSGVEHPALALDQGALVDTATHAAAASSVGHLVRTLTTGRGTAIHRGGPTLEDMVRDEMRPFLKEWLDANLPTLVERLVQAEIERVIKATA